MADLIIDGATIITVDPQRRIISDGAVVVENQSILAVGKTHEIARNYSADTRIHAKNKILIPGLVDCHVHLAQALIRGTADDVDLIPWLRDYVWVLQGNFNPEDGKASAELCIAEMLKSGTTSFLESMIHKRYGMDGIAQVVERTGIRGCLSKLFMDLTGYAGEESIMYEGMIEDGEECIAETLAMHNKWQGAAEGRIFVWWGARTPGAVSPELYRRVAEISRKRHMRITMHLGEVQEDVEYTKTQFNQLPAEFAQEVGMMGKNVVLVHGVWISPKEFLIYRDTGTHMCHCPASNSKLASGIAPIPEMLEAGINVCLGCDGGPSNNAYDMFREMFLAAIIHKARTLDPLTMPAETVLEMATINGANALGLGKEIGSIEVGKKADLVLVDTTQLNLSPTYNPVSNIIYAANGFNVYSTIVNGQILVHEGKLMTLDEEKVIENARERGQNLLERAGVEIQSQWKTD
ncbi:MAG: amidohydrolase family protein [Candidatus Thorarchaeota archaeon]